jgi:hypothetical protein
MISTGLLTLLNSEIEKELASIDEEIGINKPLKLFELAKCVDHCFVATSYIIPKNAQGFQKWADLFQQFSTGWYVALNMVLEESEKSVSILKVDSGKEQISWANKIMTKCGDIGNLKKLFSLAHSSNFILSELTDDQTVLFRFSGEAIGIEYLESQQQKWLSETILNQTEQSNNFDQVIMPLVKGSVYSTDGRNISYHPNDIVDSYFHMEGKLYGQALIGFDSFDDNSTFNGTPFLFYKEVMMSLIGKALRHLHNCLAYQEKTAYGIINPWNTYSQILDIETLTTGICNQTKLSETTVANILDTLILDRMGLHAIAHAPGSAPPPLIRLSQTKAVFSIMGHLSNPMAYLTRCLVKKFNSDYSVAVNLREQAFKKELYNLFDKHLVTIPNNLTIRKLNNVLTDIDALIFDTKGKMVHLYQLKWMDDWGSDMNQRNSMLKNYSKSIRKWLDVVDGHIKEKGTVQFLKDAGIKNPASDIKVVKIVLGRHFSGFSNLILPKDSFYLNWAGLVKILTENPGFSVSLNSLTEHLNNNLLADELKISRPPVKDVKLRLGKYKIVTKSD